MRLDQLAPALAPLEVLRPAAVEITDLAYDTRTVHPGDLFFCVRGERVDGHGLAAEALTRGAVALVVDRPLDAEAPQVVVDDVRRAMGRAADHFFGSPTSELRVAGVTGTNGKTTTAFLLYSVLAAAGARPGLLGTVESRVGGRSRPVVRTTPEAIDLHRTFREMLDAGDRSCAMEASSHASELQRLVGVRFAVLVFTNLTQDHLDFHGTLERYFEAKRRLFLERPETPAAVNVDDPYGQRLADELLAKGRRVLRFGAAASAEIRAEELELSAAGASLRASGIDLRTPLRGRFNVENVLATVAAARLLEIEDAAIARGVEELAGVPGRFEAVDEGQPFTVIVDYAHTPDSLERVLRAARDLAENRLVCVFGCGGDRDRGKRPVMGRTVSELADSVIVTADNPRSEDLSTILAEILEGAGSEAEVEPDRSAAIAKAIGGAGPGDVIVIAGKGHEQGQQLADRTLPFDDRAVARRELRRLGARA